jgi:hypothetical protein
MPGASGDLTLVAATEACTISTLGVVAAIVTGAKSLIESKGKLGIE